jgi:ABC-type spermidine/putrescine transport system permease subunit II
MRAVVEVLVVGVMTVVLFTLWRRCCGFYNTVFAHFIVCCVVFVEVYRSARF